MVQKMTVNPVAHLATNPRQKKIKVKNKIKYKSMILK